MERQLANLTGLVQKALTHAPHTSPSPREYLQVPPGRDPYARSAGTCRKSHETHVYLFVFLLIFFLLLAIFYFHDNIVSFFFSFSFLFFITLIVFTI